MAGVYNGIFNTTKNPDQLNARSFAGTILRRMPNGVAPLFGMTAMTGRSQAKQSTHGYFSKTLVFSRVTVTPAIADGTTTAIVVSDASGIVPGHVLVNPNTNENLRVTNVVGNTLTVQRGYGRVAAAAIANNQVLVVIGSSYEEGSVRPTARSIQPVYANNFTQIFRNAWALTNTAKASLSEMGYSNIAESKRDCMMFHGMDIEAALFFGQAKMDTTGPQPIHATQGIIDAVRQYAPGNVTNFTAAVGYDDLVTALLPAYTYSTDIGEGSNRVIFCDQTANGVLQKIGKEYGEVTLTQKESSYGMVFSQFKFHKGTLNIIEHSLFNGLQVYNGFAVVVDVPAVKLAYLGDRDALEETYNLGGTNSTGAGVDSSGGSLTSELAVELINPAGCAVITGLTAAKPRQYHTVVDA